VWLTIREVESVNANRARPMLAFWLLALAAAVIAALGLHGTAVQVRTDSPSQQRTPSSQSAPATVLLSYAAPQAH
jgi:hypothetical protein